jgi:2-polyprenyl-3-methyl-5-hydroxy-6-metoxy-1,4-benzoquinol methylase
MISHTSPTTLVALATGYQRSRVLFTVIELKVPTLLAEGPKPPEDIARELGADPLATERFLDACVALGLLVQDGDAYGNAPDSQRYLVCGSPTYLGDLFARHDRASCSNVWTQFPDRLCSWRPGSTMVSTEAIPVGVERDGQHQLSLLAGEALGCALDLSTHRQLLDLGGGTGAMSIALCRRYPALRAIVLDLPAVVEVARGYVRESGLSDRIEVRAGDLVAGPLPGGCDIVLLANVLSMLSAETSTAVLDRICERLPPAGTIVLSGAMLDDEETRPLAALLLCLEDIALGAPDVERSGASYSDWLQRAGFERIERQMYFDSMCAVVGHKPR